MRKLRKLPNRQYSTRTRKSFPVESSHQFLKNDEKRFNELIWFKFEPFEMSLVQASRRLTTFWCDPKWIIIFNSPTKDSRAAASAVELTILTAYVVTSSSDFDHSTKSPRSQFLSCTQSTLVNSPFKYYWCIHIIKLKLISWKFPPIFVGKVLSLFFQRPFGVNCIRIAFEEEFESLFGARHLQSNLLSVLEFS